MRNPRNPRLPNKHGGVLASSFTLSRACREMTSAASLWERAASAAAASAAMLSAALSSRCARSSFSSFSRSASHD